MARVKTGLHAGQASVVLIAEHEQFDITEHLTPEGARKLAVTLMSAAGRAERTTTTPDWP